MSKTSRRGFLHTVIVALNALVAFGLAIPGLGYLLTPVFRKGSSSWVKLGSPRDFSSSEPMKATFKYMAQTGYSVREKNGFVWLRPASNEENGFRCLSAVCSHTGCNVAWRANEKLFVCPCHGGRYDMDGNVVSGPPPRPLTQLAIKNENDELLVQIPG